MLHIYKTNDNIISLLTFIDNKNLDKLLYMMSWNLDTENELVAVKTVKHGRLLGMN